MIEIKLVELTDNTEGKITRIYKNISDEINPDDLLFDIEANKNNVTVKTNAIGKITDIKVEVGQIVKNGDILALVDGEVEETENLDTVSIDEKGKPSTVNFDYFSNLLQPKKVELDSEITIIGAGPGGYVAALQAAKLGAKVVLIEKDTVGGTCLNRGCIPTKALVRSAEIYKNLQEADHFGCHAEKISIDMKKVISRKNDIVNQLVQGIHYLLEHHNVKVVRGIGKIVDKETVYVKDKNIETVIHSKNIIIATGSKISKLPIPGLGLDNILDSDTALDLEELPRRLVIIGGGVIGMEFAFIYANFGVEVTIIEYVNEVLATCDSDICHEISKIAKSKGIKLYIGSKVEEIIESENGQCIVVFNIDNEKKYITTDKVLVAVGREPVLDGLGIEELGIELNDNGRGIKINDKMQTNFPTIYAIGDVTDKVLLAHVASHQGMVAVKNILGKDCLMDYNTIPSVIFTDPEIAMVGIGEKAAKDLGIEINIGTFPFAANGKALTFGETLGFIKLISAKESGEIIGGSIIGPHATDLIAEIALAVKNRLTAEEIIETIHAHPTTAEVVHEAALALEGGAIHFAQ